MRRQDLKVTIDHTGFKRAACGLEGRDAQLARLHDAVLECEADGGCRALKVLPTLGTSLPLGEFLGGLRELAGLTS